MAIFRDYPPSPAERSDRSAGDRLRHRQKVREAIRGNIADIIAEESIIGKDRNKVIKVPIRGVKEYRFVYGENAPGVGQGGDETQPGQVIGKGTEGSPEQMAGDQPGIDYYETDVTLDELVEVMFEDLELQNLEKKGVREIEVEHSNRRLGYRKKGIRVHLDKKRTVKKRVRRKKGMKGSGEASPVESVEAFTPDGDMIVLDEEERFPFHQDDLTYHHKVVDTRRESNAVVFCIMDTSGSMDTAKKYLARSFFFLLYQFLRVKYQRVEIVFIAHDTEAREVTEEEFFHKGEAGGTFISSGYCKVLEIIQERYNSAIWNIYAFHCSDGDNFESDNPAALKAAEEIAEVANLFGYGEIKPLGSGYSGNSMTRFFSQIKKDNFQTVQIQRKEDIGPAFKQFLSKERRAA